MSLLTLSNTLTHNLDSATRTHFVTDEPFYLASGFAEWDDNNKPKKILSIDYGVPKEMISPLAMYNNEKAGTNTVSPIVFTEPNSADTNDGIPDLESQGWQMYK